MRYDRIEIIGCDRFSVSGITGLTITPESRVQMILGKNGAGKSSLMNLGFTPFAPSKDFFPNGGSWKVHLFHKGSPYTLSATYDGKPSYSFVDANGEELNKSRNVTTQNDLIRIHLGLTEDIQDLVMGNVLLTGLTSQQRRDWMAKLSDSDFNFAFKALNFYKKKQNHHNSISSYLKKQINGEKEQLVQEVDLNLMTKRREELQKEYDEIQQLPNYPIDRQVTLDDLRSSIEELLEETKAYLLKETYSPTYASIEALNEALNDTHNQTQHLKGSIDVLSADIVEIQQQLGRIENLLGEDYAGLVSKQEKLSDQLNKLIVDESIPTHYLSNAGEVIEAIRYVLVELPSEIPDKDQIAAIKTAHDETLVRLGKAQQMIEQINSNLDLIHKVEVIECPSCKHSFKPGIDPELYDKLVARRTAGLSYVKEQSDELETYSDRVNNVMAIENCGHELQMIRDRYIRQYPGLFGYLDSIDGWGVGKTLDSHLQRYESACMLNHKREHLVNQMAVLKQAIDSQTAYTAELPSLKARLDEKMAKYQTLNDQHGLLSTVENDILTEKRLNEEDDEECKSIHYKLTKLYLDIDKFVEYKCNVFRNEDLRKVTTSIAVLEDALNKNDVIHTRIKDYERSLSEHQLLEQGAKAIVDELSPKSGLIAEQIRQQIGSVLGAMNAVIRKIWGYDIKIGIGEVSDGGLDYKLPLIVGGVTRRDISEGSSSMKEIINRAWVITAMVCLGMEDYPLYQDEPAITFDDEHGLNFIPMLKELIETDKFSQLVIISHDADTQTAFPSADTLILGDMKINHIPRFNEHVEFHY